MSHHLNIGDNMHINPHVNNHTIGGEVGFHGSHGSIGGTFDHHHGENTFGGTGTLHLPHTDISGSYTHSGHNDTFSGGIFGHPSSTSSIGITGSHSSTFGNSIGVSGSITIPF